MLVLTHYFQNRFDPVFPEDERFRRIASRLLVVVGALAVHIPLIDVPPLNREAPALTPRTGPIRLTMPALWEPEPPFGTSVETAVEPVTPVPDSPTPLLATVRTVAPHSPTLELRPKRDLPSRPEPNIDDRPLSPPPADSLEDIFSGSGLSELVNENNVNSAVGKGTVPLIRGQRDNAPPNSKTPGVLAGVLDGELALVGVDTSRIETPVGGGSGEALTGRDVTVVENSVFETYSRGARTSAVLADLPSERELDELNRAFETAKHRFAKARQKAEAAGIRIRGKLVLQLTIAPSGEVSGVRILKNEIVNSDFAARIKAVVEELRFEARDVPTVTVTYPLDFV